MTENTQIKLFEEKKSALFGIKKAKNGIFRLWM